MSNEIHRKTLRGGANFLVTSPTVATILESIPGYAADTDGDQSRLNGCTENRCFKQSFHGLQEPLHDREYYSYGLSWFSVP